MTKDTEQEGPLPGLVAYGLYKIAKREWARELQERESRKPNDDELQAYIRTWTPSQLENVQQRAQQTLAEYAEAVIEAEEPKILRQALKGKFWPSVWPSMTASFLYTVILIGLAIILARAGIDLIGILKTAASG